MRVFVGGTNTKGQLNGITEIVDGDGSEEDNAPNKDKLIEMKLNFKIKHIACGYYRILILTQHNELFGCGSNEEGELGLNDNINKHHFTKIDTLQFLDNDDKINSIACGGHHSVLLTKNNNLYLTGRKIGKLLQLNTYNSLQFKKCDFNFDKIKLVKCTSGFTFVLNSKGDLFTNNNFSFYKFYSNPDIIDFNCGFDHVVMLDKFGQLFFTGSQREDVMKYNLPFKVKQIGCSYTAFSILNEMNELYISDDLYDNYKESLDKFNSNLEIKKLFFGWSDNLHFITKTNNLYYIHSEEKCIKELKFDKQINEKYIYPFMGWNFIYVITSNTPLLSLRSDENNNEIKFHKLFKQLTFECKFKDISFLF